MDAINEILKKFNIEDMSQDDLRKTLDELEIETYNNSVGDLNEKDGLNCELCKNKGWVQGLKDGRLTMFQCKCSNRRALINKAKNSGLGEYLNKKIEDYKVFEQWQLDNANKMTAFIENHSTDNTWFVALGTSGCGKTLMCSIIANHLLYESNRDVIYVTWTDFISKLKRDIMGDQTNAVSAYLEEIKNIDVLFLDELIKKYTEADLRYLIEIINYRYTNNLKTIITSERVIDELLDIDEATFSRAVSKCEGYLINVLKDRRKNYRLKEIL